VDPVMAQSVDCYNGFTSLPGKIAGSGRKRSGMGRRRRIGMQFAVFVGCPLRPRWPTEDTGAHRTLVSGLQVKHSTGCCFVPTRNVQRPISSGQSCVRSFVRQNVRTLHGWGRSVDGGTKTEARARILEVFGCALPLDFGHIILNAGQG
jgi:hypothetical protein